MIAVTTFSRTGYETYAKEMLESAVENWPTKLIVYTEYPIDFRHEKIEERNFFDIPHTQNFYQYLKATPLTHGMTPKGYNYNYDAWKFTRKVFAQYDVLKDYDGKVFWLDADVRFKKPVPVEFLDGLFEGNPLAFLGRKGFYTETGFIGFDTQRPRFHDFLDKYIGCLRHGIVFTLPRWHDCEVFDWARNQTGIEERNLSPFFEIPENKRMSLEELDVFKRSVLGEYMDHLKGGRKNAA